MKKQGRSNFNTKFQLLNSQENTNSEVIIWSSSDSSDYENTSYSNNFKNLNKISSKSRKRKRANARRKVSQVSGLNVSFTDIVKQELESKNYQKLSTACNINVSPILNTTQFYTNNSMKSPILPLQIHNDRTSPVLPLKVTPPKPLTHVKKKLFSNNKKLDISKEINKILEKSCENHSEYNFFNERNEKNLKNSTDNQITKTHLKILDVNRNFDDKSLPKEEKTNYKEEVDIIDKSVNKELINKIKSYFSKDLTSDPLSQHSNIECDTSQSSDKTSLEITNITQEKLENMQNIQECNLTERIKKIKYKKDGLAYRLNSLIKKQNANISLWQHERYLAANTNFIIPKGDFTGFRIQNVQYKYNIYLLQCKDVDNKYVLICINNLYVSDICFQSDMILKIYVPFKTINLSNMNIIINVSKFECKKL